MKLTLLAALAATSVAAEKYTFVSKGMTVDKKWLIVVETVDECLDAVKAQPLCAQDFFFWDTRGNKKCACHSGTKSESTPTTKERDTADLYKINAEVAEVAEDGEVAEPTTIEGPSLKEAAKGTGIWIGTAMNWRKLTQGSGKTDDYSPLSAYQYNMISTENQCKMAYIAKSYDELDFTGCDYLVKFAKENNQQIRMHVLVWGSSGKYPQFIEDETDPVKLENFMIKYIQTFMKRYEDYPVNWDIVNESVSNAPPTIVKESAWSKVDDYICKAFKAAKASNPKAQLFYNDYKYASKLGVYESKNERVFQLVKDLKDRNCGLDAVGMQSHVDINYADENFASIAKSMAEYNEIGLDVQLTEIDVRCHQKGNEPCPVDVWTTEMRLKQANVYSKLLKTCLESPNCSGFIMWGFTDKYSFLPSPQDGFPFDADFNPKIAFTSILNTLKDFPRDNKYAIAKVSQGWGTNDDESRNLFNKYVLSKRQLADNFGDFCATPAVYPSGAPAGTQPVCTVGLCCGTSSKSDKRKRVERVYVCNGQLAALLHGTCSYLM